jgi:hypothetical protein
VARLPAVGPAAVHPLLTRWFDDERPLPATAHATVATAAQALLHTHRRRALHELTEVLADRAHGRAANCSPISRRRSRPPSAGPSTGGRTTSGPRGGRRR